MSRIDFDIEWQDPGAARGPELHATWARLQIAVEGEFVTRLYDTSLNSVRTGVYLPLYPLAEWIVTNWWALLYECVRPSQATSKAYGRRHNIRNASEGYALPSLEIRPTAGHFELTWQRRTLPDCRLEFLRYGAATLASASVEDSLSTLVKRVIARLDEKGVADTVLQRDWMAIEAQDEDQTAFCRAAGAMGLDPFDLPSQIEDKIVNADHVLPDSVESDFFEAAEPTRIDQQLQWVQEGLELADGGSDLPALRSLRERLNGINGETTPWAQGYAFARRLRQELGLGDKERVDLAELGLGDAGGGAIVEHPRHAQVGFDALTVVGSSGNPGFVVRQTLKPNQRFACCRALFEYLCSPASATSLISSTVSDKQKRNRAFAAELLAPASLLEERLSGDRIGSTELDELAQRFDVSSYVIEHQIRNHQLGWVL
jgi:hypothetical protein